MKKSIIALLCLVTLPYIGLTETELVQITSDDGVVLREDYLDDGRLTMGEKGFARHTFEYDDRGNPIVEAFYDDSGALTENKDGIVVLKREYDDDNRVSRIWYLGTDDQPMIYKKSGAYGEAFKYNEAGRVVLNVRLDAEGNPMTGIGGLAKVTYAYDENGKRNSESYFGVDGEVVLLENRFSRIDRVYDANGNVIRETYYDITGGIGKNNAGQIVLEKTYDEVNNLISEINLDAEGNRRLQNAGWCEHRMVYKEDIARFPRETSTWGGSKNGK